MCDGEVEVEVLLVAFVDVFVEQEGVVGLLGVYWNGTGGVTTGLSMSVPEILAARTASGSLKSML